MKENIGYYGIFGGAFVQDEIKVLCDELEVAFNKYVEELGIHRSYGETEFCAVMPEGENEKILGTNHIPLLKQTILWNVDDKPFELTYHYFVGSSYSITSDLQIIHN